MVDKEYKHYIVCRNVSAVPDRDQTHRMRLPSGSFSYAIMVMEIVVSSLPRGAVVLSGFITILSLDRESSGTGVCANIRRMTIP